MNKTAWTLAATAALLWTTALRADDGDVVVRHFVKQFPASGIERVFVDVPVGDVVIEGSTAAQVELEVNLECADRGGSCEELAQRVKVVFSRDEGELTLRVKEWPKSTNRGLEAHIRVLMPRQIDLRADLAQVLVHMVFLVRRGRQAVDRRPGERRHRRSRRGTAQCHLAARRHRVGERGRGHR